MTNQTLVISHSNKECGILNDEKKPDGSSSSSMKADVKRTVDKKAVEKPSNSDKKESKNEEQQTKQIDSKKVSSSA